jgi:hypothetical protein
MESKLSKVIKGKLQKPLRATFYGPEGCGKSSLAADSEAPIFIDIDGGSSQLETDRYPFGESTQPKGFKEVESALHDLLYNEHNYKTVILDTVDKLEGLIWRYIIDRDLKPVKGEVHTIESFGYGKGYTLALDEWRKLIVLLDKLWDKGMNIILISHASIKTFQNPEGDNYDRYSLRIHEKAAGLIREWSDVTGFMCFDEFAFGGDKSKGIRSKGTGTKRRLIKFQRTATYDAKSRLPLAEEVEVAIDHPWQPLAKAIEESKGHTLSTLNLAILTELSRIADEEIIAKVTPFMDKATHEDNKAALFRLLNQLKAKPSKAESEQVQ